MDNVRKILFLCTGNSARSQMGEALLRKHAGHIFKVFSAGTDPEREVYPPVVEVMKEIGIDISGQKPKELDQLPGKGRFEKVIIVCSHAAKHCPSFFGTGDKIFWPFMTLPGQRGHPRRCWPYAAGYEIRSTGESVSG